MKVVKLHLIKEYTLKGEVVNPKKAYIDIKAVLEHEIEQIDNDIEEYRKAGDDASVRRENDVKFGVQKALKLLIDE